MPDDDHQSLVESATGGDPIAIEVLLERHLPGLMTYVRLHLGNELATREAPHDVAQSVCRDVLQIAQDFDYRGEGAFRNWLYKKAIAKICDRQRYWQAQKRDPAREAGEARYAIRSLDGSPSEILIREESVQRLRAAFTQLPEDYRQVVRLAFVVGLSRREIAEEMQRSEAAVRSLLHRALARVGFLMSDPAMLGIQSEQAES